jgi:NADH:ubiquinone oxidoreductase subunit 5 (subunit L)/multisubunit Na+/H+ antiporter MnhA subunit
MQAMIVNRIGDVGLALAMFVCFATFKSIEFSTMFSLAPYVTSDVTSLCGFSINSLTLIGILLFIGAVGKSAQLGLHV